jgi:hypothetical protein
MARVQFPAVQDFSLLHSVQTDSGAHPISYPVGTVGFFAGVKLHLVPCSRKVELYLHSLIYLHDIVLN